MPVETRYSWALSATPRGSRLKGSWVKGSWTWNCTLSVRALRKGST